MTKLLVIVQVPVVGLLNTYEYLPLTVTDLVFVINVKWFTVTSRGILQLTF